MDIQQQWFSSPLAAQVMVLQDPGCRRASAETEVACHRAEHAVAVPAVLVAAVNVASGAVVLAVVAAVAPAAPAAAAAAATVATAAAERFGFQCCCCCW